MDVMELIVDALRNAGLSCGEYDDTIFVDRIDGKCYSLTVEECEGDDVSTWPICADCGKRINPESDDLRFVDNGRIPLCRECYADREKDDGETALRDPDDFEKNRHLTED